MYGLINPFQRKKNDRVGTILHLPGVLDAKICHFFFQNVVWLSFSQENNEGK